MKKIVIFIFFFSFISSTTKAQVLLSNSYPQHYSVKELDSEMANMKKGLSNSFSQHYSVKELDYEMRKMKKGRNIGLIMAGVGIPMAIVGEPSLESTEGGNFGTILFAVGVASALSGLTIACVSQLFIWKKQQLTFEVLPSNQFDYITQSYQLGITLRLKI